MLPYDFRQVSELAQEIDRWRRLLDHRGPLTRSWLGRLRRDLETEAVAASTSMEGVAVTIDEVRRILAGERPAEVTPEDIDLVLGYRNAMGFVLRRADDPNFRWDRELLVSLHDRILAGRFALGAGRLRTGAAFLVDGRSGERIFAPPPEDRVEGLVDDLCRRMEDGHPHPTAAAAWVHVALAAVHPFSDGNGRMARVCASLAMYRGGFKLPEFTSLEEWWGRHLSEYYSAFSCLGPSFDTDADVTPFIVAHVRGQLQQIRALDLRERVERGVWTVIEGSVEDAGLDRRVANAVWDAFFDREVTSRYYRPLADVTAATAAADFRGAVAAGLLQPLGAGRSRRYVAGEDLYRRVGDALGIRVDERGEAARSLIAGTLAERAAAAADEDRHRD